MRRWQVWTAAGLLALGAFVVCWGEVLFRADPPPAEKVLDQQQMDEGRQRAQDALRNFATAIEAQGGLSKAPPIGTFTNLVGTWEPGVAANNQAALEAGAITLDPGTDIGPPMAELAKVSFFDVERVPISRPYSVVDYLKRRGGGDCGGCTPLRITATRVISTVVETGYGPMSLPTWEFTLAGTAVKLTRVVLAVPSPVKLPDLPIARQRHLMPELATVSSDGRRVTVEFTGAGGTADHPCGEDYPAEVYESPTAVAVVIGTLRLVGGRANGVVCTQAGYRRTVTVTLAKPLGNRAVLRVADGRALPLVGW